jgi:hypothetical protein
MMLKEWLALGVAGASIASPLSVNGRQQNALVEQDPQGATKENMRLISLSPTDIRWVTQEKLLEVIRVSLKYRFPQVEQF